MSSLAQHHALNTCGRDFAVADIHSHFTRLDADCPYNRWTDFTDSLIEPLPTNRDRKLLTQQALRSRERIESGDCIPVQDVAAIIVGHTPGEEIWRLAHVYYIDTGACFERMNKLTLVQRGPAAGIILQETAVA